MAHAHYFKISSKASGDAVMNGEGAPHGRTEGAALLGNTSWRLIRAVLHGDDLIYHYAQVTADGTDQLPLSDRLESLCCNTASSSRSRPRCRRPGDETAINSATTSSSVRQTSRSATQARIDNPPSWSRRRACLPAAPLVPAFYVRMSRTWNQTCGPLSSFELDTTRPYEAG